MSGELAISVGENIRLIGTAHVSMGSIELVRSEIETWKPDVVAVELCASRHSALVEDRRLDKESLLKVIKEGKAPLVIAQGMLAAEQRKLGLDEGLQPGAELLEAVRLAEENECEVALVDRDIQVTLRRAWSRMGWRERFRLLYSLVAEDDEDEDVPSVDEILRDGDLMTMMLEELREAAPGAGVVLVDERDEYLAHSILGHSDGKRVLAVIGAGHLNGVQSHLESLESPDPERLETLSELPKRGIFKRFLPWLIPLLLLGLVIRSGMQQDFDQLLQIFTIWMAANAICAAIGVALARGHILSILVAALASPITSLNPFLAAGWFAGYVQLKIDEPTGEDLANFLKLDNISLYWRNPAGKVLLVTAFGNLGSMSGAWVAASMIGALAAI